MKKWARYFLVGTVITGLLSGVSVWGQSQTPSETIATPESTPTAGAAVEPVEKVNINTADEAALMTLNGIGESKAKAIIEYRQKNGPFTSVEDLTKVKGIGEKTLTQLRDSVTIE